MNKLSNRMMDAADIANARVRDGVEDLVEIFVYDRVDRRVEERVQECVFFIVLRTALENVNE